MIDVPPIPADDTSRLTYDELGERFVATVKLSTKWGRSVWLSTSDDFNDWTEPELIFHSDEIDGNNSKRRIRQIVDDPAYLTPPIVDQARHPAQVYEMTVMPYEGLYVAFPVLFNPAGALPPPRGNHNGVNQTELAVSRDLRDWKRVANRDLFLGVLPWDGEVYDTAQILTCGRPVVREDWARSGSTTTPAASAPWTDQHDESFAPYFQDLNCVALAKVRLDGFVSLDAEKRGTMVTTPFVLDGGLFVNVNAAGGEMRAELVDAEDMRPLPGFSLADCDPVNGDHLGRELTWGGRPASPRQRPVRLPLRDEPRQALRLLGRITATPHS